MPKGERITLTCQQCEKKFKVCPCFKKQKYCCFRCYWEVMKGRKLSKVTKQKMRHPHKYSRRNTIYTGGGCDTYRKYDVMYQKLVIEKKSLEKIAEEFKCCLDTIRNWAKKLGMEESIPRHHAKPGEKISLICQYCGEKFETWPYEKDKKYCSNACFRKSTKGRIGWNKGLQGTDPNKDNYDERLAKQSKSLKGKKAWNEGLKKENSESMMAIAQKLIKNTAFKSSKIKKIIKESKIKNNTTPKDVWRKQRTEILAKTIKTSEERGITGGYNNMFATEFFKYFDWSLNTKGHYGKHEKWIWDKAINYRCRVDYFNAKMKIWGEWDEEHHYHKDNKLTKEDNIKEAVVKKKYPDFFKFRIRERDYFSEKKYLKRITEKDYEVFDKIIEDIKVIIE